MRRKRPKGHDDVLAAREILVSWLSVVSLEQQLSVAVCAQDWITAESCSAELIREKRHAVDMTHVYLKIIDVKMFPDTVR